MRHVLLSLLMLTAFVGKAQVVITGRVVDARTGEALAFVPVNRAGTPSGTVSDIDGRFRLEVPGLPAVIRLSYVGYETLELTVTEPTPAPISLKQRDTELRAVVVNAAVTLTVDARGQ
ncbi:MAG TPA: carboxypeptidase-like regulatory domain-containing protein, partial [Flavobacteriales bacterium]|nr:carboxypeptidase-like regulatory domain-containing protein [Flavobacteriales bacterium]